MKRLIVVGFVVLTCLTLTAQRKIFPGVTRQGFTTTPKGFTDDFDAAALASKKSGKPIYAVFFRSDRNSWDIMTPLNKSEFVEEASKHFELVFIESPHNKRAKSKLSAKAFARNLELIKKYEIHTHYEFRFIFADGTARRPPFPVWGMALMPTDKMPPKKYAEILARNARWAQGKVGVEIKSTDAVNMGRLKTQNLTSANHICGPKLTEKDLQRKVVLVEYFGAGCGFCDDAAKGTVRLTEQFKNDRRFLLIFGHSFGQEKANAGEHFLKQLNLAQYSAYHKIKLGDVRTPAGVPHAVLFNHRGELVWWGHPALEKEMESAIKGALAEMPEFFCRLAKTPDLLALRKTRYNYDQTKGIAYGENLESIRKELVKRAKKDDAKGKEAKEVLLKIDAWIAHQKELVDWCLSSRPSYSLYLLRKLNKMVPSQVADYESKWTELLKNKQVATLESIRWQIEGLQQQSENIRGDRSSHKKKDYQWKVCRKLEKRLSLFDQSSEDVKDVLALLYLSRPE